MIIGNRLVKLTTYVTSERQREVSAGIFTVDLNTLFVEINRIFVVFLFTQT
jgi:hypothetical protein